ncbi:MAG: EAL domain-containing protein [Burkholderiaceae bacterium]
MAGALGRLLGNERNEPRLNAIGILLSGLAALAIATAAGALVAGYRLQMAIESQAEQVAEGIAQYLASLAIELDDVAALAPPGCDMGSVHYLVDRSLDSDLVRRLYLLPRGATTPCVPASGAQLVTGLALPQRVERVETRLLPVTGHPGSLLAVRLRPGQRIVVAEIDPRQPLEGLASPAVTAPWIVHFQDLAGREIAHLRQDVSSTWSVPSPFDGRVLRSKTLPDVGLRITVTDAEGAFAAALRATLAGMVGIGALLWYLIVSRANLRLQRRGSIERRLRDAIAARRIDPVIQPIVDARTGRCTGGEILMRWNHPARGLIAPGEFIHLAEQTGLIVPMMRQLLTKAQEWLGPVSLERPELQFSFNLSAHELRDPALFERLARLFDGSLLTPERMCIEFVERDAADEQIRAALGRLREQGFRIAVDDFGTGQSNLSLLGRMSFDRLKIDREFVRTIDDDSSRHSVLDAIIDLARRLDVALVAEGVETEAQQRYLVEQGVDYLQGYLIARPMRVAEFADWLAQNERRSRTAPTRPRSLDDPGATGRNVDAVRTHIARAEFSDPSARHAASVVSTTLGGRDGPVVSRASVHAAATRATPQVTDA